MYGLKLCGGGFIGSLAIKVALAKLEVSGEVGLRRMREMVAVERLEGRGMQYSNQDFDVLSSALNFLDAVAPDAAGELRACGKA